MRLQTLLTLFLVVFGARKAHSKRLVGRHDRVEYEAGVEREYDFPKVYTAVVPSPQEPKVRRFIAELDILGLEMNQKNGDYAKVKFMVHGPQELSHIKEQSSDFVTEFDIKLTRKYKKKAEPRTNSAGTKNASYPTIEGFPCYRNLAGIEQLMVDLVDYAKSIPNLEVELTDIGDSYLKTQNSTEGYDIWALKITGHGTSVLGSISNNKGVMFVMTGIHAREYAPPELAARFAETLINLYGHDADVTAMLDHTEIHIVLHSNPDGRYEAEVAPALYRRKNMNGDSSQCWAGEWGVDLNRNFPFRWGLDSGSSSFLCSQTYRGESPASEPEVKAIVDYVSDIFPEEQRKDDPDAQIDEIYPENITGIFFDLHSYGEIIIWPWGHENKETANDYDLEALVRKYRHFNGYGFSGPNTPGFLYEASGTTDDFAFGSLGLPGMTFEVGNEFYEDCEYFTSSILPSNIPALTYAAKVSRAPYLLSKGPDVTSIVLTPNTMTNSESSVLTISANISDSAFSFGNFPTSQQSISSAHVFIDAHPHSVGSPSGLDMNGSFTSGSETVSLSLSLTQLLQEINLPLLGRHTLYIQGTDSDGYTGPVTAAFFHIVASSDTPDEECMDSSESFVVDNVDVGSRTCDWLAINLGRFEYLCNLVKVGRLCPKTCQQCELFGRLL